jgi:signal transduction histidine kinase
VVLQRHLEQNLPVDTVDGVAEVRSVRGKLICLPVHSAQSEPLVFQASRTLENQTNRWFVDLPASSTLFGQALESLAPETAQRLTRQHNTHQAFSEWTSADGIAWQSWRLMPESYIVVAERASARLERHRTVQRAASEWVATLDGVSDGVALVVEGQVIRCNHAFAHMAGVDEWTFRPTPLAEMLNAFLANTAPPDLIDGAVVASSRGASFRVSLKQPRGMNGAVVYTFRDVTDSVRADRLAAAIVQMETTGVMMAGIRHELRNPMMAWSTGLEALRRILPPSNDPRVNTVLRSLDTALDRIEFVLEGLRPIQENEPLTRDTIDLSEFVNAFMRTAKAEALSRAIDIELKLTPRLQVVGDRRALHQVLRNLFVNAMDAIESAGTERRVALHTERGESGQVTLRVVDSGKGIEASVAQHLFQPFETSKPDGTGLGLYVTKKLVSRLGGSIEAGLHLGNTAFVVTLQEAST